MGLFLGGIWQMIIFSFLEFFVFLKFSKMSVITLLEL